MSWINMKIWTISTKFHYPYEWIFGTSSTPTHIIKEITWNWYINLTNAVANELLELKAYWWTRQWNLPYWYTEVEYIQWDWTARIDLNTALDEDDEIDIKFSYTWSITWQNVFGWRTNASAQNITAFFAWTANRFVLDFNNSDYSTYRAIWDITAWTVYDIVIDKAKRQIKNWDTVVFENTTACEDTIDLTTAYLFFASWSPAYQTKFTWNIYSCKIAWKINLIPCKDSNNVVWMYDTISWTFFTNSAESWSFTAWPDKTATPTEPMNIISNNWIIKVKHQSWLPTWYKLLQSIRNNSNAILDTGIQLADTDVVEMRFFNNSDTWYWAWYWVYASWENTAFYANQTYYWYDWNNSKVNTQVAVDTLWHDVVHDFVNWKLTLDWVDTTFTPFSFTNTINNKLFCRYYGWSYWYYVKWRICYYRVKRNWVLIQNLIPCTRLNDNTVWMYDLVSWTFIWPDWPDTFEEWSIATDPLEIYTDWLTETIEDELSNTATAEMLLSAWDNKDVQEILTWSITRNVGILVFDWVNVKLGAAWNSTYKRWNISVTGIKQTLASVVDCRCNYFPYSASVNGNPTSFGFCSRDNDALVLFSFLWVDWVNSANEANSWFADRYNEWNPVILIYPLATPTTETVTWQTLNIEDWSNTIEITQASIENLPLYAKYKATA